MADELDASQKDSKVKGILKHTPSLEDPRSEVHWDEMNILQTFHPSDKDYGHMKIEEPPTPYNYKNDGSDSEEIEQLDPDQLASKMQSVPAEGSNVVVEDETSSDEDLSPEEQKTKKVFLDKRKFHYNEYDKVKLARELIEKELAELEDDDDKEQGN